MVGVPPVPILLLLIRVSLAEVLMVVMGFNLPTLVVGSFITIPPVISPRKPGRTCDREARTAQSVNNTGVKSAVANRIGEMYLCLRDRG
jgi:hypothetical protein